MVGALTQSFIKNGGSKIQLHKTLVLYTNYFNFQCFYLHTFYKPNNIKTKPSRKLETYTVKPV